MVAYTLVLVAIIAVACNQPYSQPPNVTNTPINPNSLFATPIGGPTNMTDVQNFVTGTSQALTGTPAGVIATQTPLGDTSQENSFAMAVLNITSEVQADGTVKKTADLSITPLGLGSVQLTSPSTIRLGESSFVRLTITPDSALAELPQVTVSTASENDPGYVLEFNDRLQVYPIMVAELEGANFDIVSDGHSQKVVTSAMPVEWIWSVTPKSGGEQTLILEIYVPVFIDQRFEIFSPHSLKNIPIEIQVEVTATPNPSEIPQPTQLPAITRIGEQLVQNASSILVAVIALIGVLTGAYVNYLNSRKSITAGPPTKAKSRKNK